MKVLSAQQIRQADAYTIAHEPISSVDLMERAATAATQALINHLQRKAFTPRQMHFFCGRGNNGGDGLVMARLLSSAYKVHVWICPIPENPSADFAVNLQRLEQLNRGIAIQTLTPDMPFPPLQKDDLCVDCLFGSGLNRPPEGLAAALIAYLNSTDAYKVAIDIPSGLFADKPVSDASKVFHANYTLTFELPKQSFLYDHHYRFTGEWEIVSIGLHTDFLNNAATQVFYSDLDMVKKCYQPRKKIAHKGDFGHALIVAGSMGKMGAAMLAAAAALRAGVGLLTAAVPAFGLPLMQVAVPEAMCVPNLGDIALQHLPDVTPYSSIGIGPGIGQHKDTADAIEALLTKSNLPPMVWDADALNLLAKNPHWWEQIPAGSILTPHPKEFERLVGVATTDFARHEWQLRLSSKYRCIVVLKGAHTCITTPNGISYFNATGNPGMATGGSGDVLTGILTALLAQNYPAETAAVLGVFLHGLAGDLAAAKLSQPAMKAGDIVDSLPAAWQQITQV